MGLLQWTADGGTDSTNITVANSGTSGPACSTITPTNNAAQQYKSAAAKHGAAGVRVNSAASTTTYLEWAFEAAADRGVMCFAFRVNTALPSGDVVIAGLRGGSNANWMAQLVLKSTGAFHPRNSATTQLTALSGVTIAVGTWYWVELAAKKGTGTGDGEIQARVWADGASMPSFTTYANVNAGTTQCSHVRVGVPQSGAATIDYYWDDLQWREGLASGTGIGQFTDPPAISLGADQTLESRTALTLTATRTSGATPDTWAWRQISGQAVTLTSSGATCALTTPANWDGTALVIGCTPTAAGVTGAEDTVTITVQPHVWWTRHGAGPWVPCAPPVPA